MSLPTTHRTCGQRHRPATTCPDGSTGTDHRAGLEAADQLAGNPSTVGYEEWATARRARRIAYLADVAGLEAAFLPRQIEADLRHLANLQDTDGLARTARLLDAAAPRCSCPDGDRLAVCPRHGR